MRIVKIILLLSLAICFNCFAGISFDGVDDLITVSNIVNNATAFTISVWFKNTGAGTTNVELWSEGVSTSADNCSVFAIDPTVTPAILYFIQKSATIWGPDLVYQNALVEDGNFHNAVVVHRTSTDMELYFDGVSVDTETTSTTAPVGINQAAIGCLRRNTNSNFYDNIITEVDIWTVALTVPQVTLLSSSYLKGISLQIQSSNLKGYWPMDDQPVGTSADGDTIRDLSGNGNNGTGVDGANNTGCLWAAETICSYPSPILQAR